MAATKSNVLQKIRMFLVSPQQIPKRSHHGHSKQAIAVFSQLQSLSQWLLEETGTESEMTEGTEILKRFLQNVHGEEFQENRESRERNHTSSIHSVESSVAIRIEKIAACSCKSLIGISS